MIHVSKYFKERLKEDIAYFHEEVAVTLADGTEFTLTEANIWENGLGFEDSISSDDGFDVGSAIVNQVHITVNNIYEDYSAMDFYGAKLVFRIGVETQKKVPIPIMLSSESYLGTTDGDLIYTGWNGFPTIEWIKKGTYYVNDQRFDGNLITLTAYDSMSLFDRDYSESELSWASGYTLRSIVQDACDVCGVTLDSKPFPHQDYIITTQITSENRTFREVIGLIAQMIGCHARVNRLDKLEFIYYNTEILANLNSGVAVADDTYHSTEGFYSNNIDVDDVTITGIRIIESVKTEDGANTTQEWFSGEEGYVLTIQDNDLIHDGIGETAVGWIAEKYVGMRFRPFDTEGNCDPTIEAGDIVEITDYKGRVYYSVVTRSVFSPGAGQNVACTAESTVRNAQNRYTQTAVNTGNTDAQINQIAIAMRAAAYIPAVLASVSITTIVNPFSIVDSLHEAAASPSVYFAEVSTMSIEESNEATAALTPLSAQRVYWLTGWRHDYTNGKQILRSYSDNTAYVRNYINGEWGSWEVM